MFLTASGQKHLHNIINQLGENTSQQSVNKKALTVQVSERALGQLQKANQFSPKFQIKVLRMIYFILCIRCTSSDKNPTRVKIFLLAPFICYKIKYLRDVHCGVFLLLRQSLPLIICKLHCTCPQMVLACYLQCF